MPTLDLGKVQGDPGTSVRNKGEWAPNIAYVNNQQYIDIVANGGNSYCCKNSHTSGSTFSSENWSLVAQKGDKGDKGDMPTIVAGVATQLASNASPTVSSNTNGNITTFNFGIPKGDTSKMETPTFADTVNTYSTLTDANTAAETSSNAIKSQTSIFTILSNIKKSFSAIVQGLKILGTNVGMIQGITSDLNAESDYIAASSKALATLNSNLEVYFTPRDFNPVKGDKFGNGSFFYIIKSGICFVTIECTPTEKLATGDVVCTGLPIPKYNTYFSLSTATGNYTTILKKTGVLEIYYPSFTAAARIDCTFSYPIA